MRILCSSSFSPYPYKLNKINAKSVPCWEEKNNLQSQVQSRPYCPYSQRPRKFNQLLAFVRMREWRGLGQESGTIWRSHWTEMKIAFSLPASVSHIPFLKYHWALYVHPPSWGLAITSGPQGGPDATSPAESIGSCRLIAWQGKAERRRIMRALPGGPHWYTAHTQFPLDLLRAHHRNPGEGRHLDICAQKGARAGRGDERSCDGSEEVRHSLHALRMAFSSPTSKSQSREEGAGVKIRPWPTPSSPHGPQQGCTPSAPHWGGGKRRHGRQPLHITGEAEILKRMDPLTPNTSLLLLSDCDWTWQNWTKMALTETDSE